MGMGPMSLFWTDQLQRLYSSENKPPPMPVMWTSWAS